MSRFLSFGVHPRDLTEDYLEDIVSFACTAASLSTQKHGGITSVPALEDVQAYRTASR